MTLQRALAEWQHLLGVEHIVIDVEPDYALATFHVRHGILAVLYPADADQVREVVKIAAAHGAPLYPISRGKNWGYGSRLPPADGCVVVSLERLDRILDFDAQLAYITVEPGVTFAQVNTFLKAQGTDVIINSPGSTSDASLIGNALERGIASGLDAERCAAVCGMEVILSDARRFRTGFGRFADAQAAPVAAHGVGAALDGLFFQSNFGIVTQMTFWLTPAPSFHQHFTFRLTEQSSFDGLITRLQMVKRENLVQSSVGLYNAFKLLTHLRQHPNPPRLITLSELPDDYQALLGGGVWFGEGLITAPDAAIGALMRKRLREQLGSEVEQLQFREGSAFIDGAASLKSIYWRKPTPMPDAPDPDRDGCGLIWCCPIVPFRAANIRQCLAILEETLPAHGFEPIIGIQCLTMRAVYIIASIVYDRRQPGHDQAALDCYHTLQARLAHAGFLPYRLPILAPLPPAQDDYDSVLRDLKAAVDPAGILAPKRYESPV